MFQLDFFFEYIHLNRKSFIFRLSYKLTLFECKLTLNNTQILPPLTASHQIFLCTSSKSRMTFDFILKLCIYFLGLQWNEFFTPVSYHDQLQPGHIALMLILDTILYMLIAMYVEKIRPGLYGVPLPWYFPVTKSFWRPNKHKVEGQWTCLELNKIRTDYVSAFLKLDMLCNKFYI